MDLYTLLEAQKARLRPDNDVAEADQVVDQINSVIKEKDIKAFCTKGGSLAKGTFIKDDFDIDLFVLFDYSYKDSDISALLEVILEDMNPILLHGSRDYYQLRQKYTYEIIPVLDVKNYRNAKNVTDMSPLHVDYIRKKLKDREHLADEIRLAKQFCKAIGIYGAESYISGFSGHVIDILIVHYGSFVNLLTAASKEWGERKIIDPELHLDDPETQLNKSKRQSPLILVDPIQPDRNAAAALSKEKYDLFRKKADEFLANPDESCFIVKDMDKDFFKAYLHNAEDTLLVLVKGVPLDRKIDISGAKMLKVYEHIKEQVIDHGFQLVDSGWQFKISEALLFFVFKDQVLSEFKEREGPPVKNKKYYAQFISKHPEEALFIRNKKVYALVKRDYRRLHELFDHVLKSKYVQDKVGKITSVQFMKKHQVE